MRTTPHSLQAPGGLLTESWRWALAPTQLSGPLTCCGASAQLLAQQRAPARDSSPRAFRSVLSLHLRGHSGRSTRPLAREHGRATFAHGICSRTLDDVPQYACRGAAGGGTNGQIQHAGAACRSRRGCAGRASRGCPTPLRRGAGRELGRLARSEHAFGEQPRSRREGPGRQVRAAFARIGQGRHHQGVFLPRRAWASDVSLGWHPPPQPPSARGSACRGADWMRLCMYGRRAMSWWRWARSRPPPSPFCVQ
jgi:hypothetical protein